MSAPLEPDSADTPDLSFPYTPVSRAHARAQVTIACRPDGSSYVQQRFAHQPYRLLTPIPEVGDPVTVVLSNLSGGMLNGDRYDLTVTVEDGASVLLTGQAAEKIYRAADLRPAVVQCTITAKAGSCVEWLPQGTICFDGARLERCTVIQADISAHVLAGDILTLGRTAMGERITRGLLRDIWQVYQDSQLVWQDRFCLTDRTRGALHDPAALASAESVALLVYMGPQVEPVLDGVREIMNQAIPDNAATGQTPVRSVPFQCGATLINGIVVMRWLGYDSRQMRHHFADVAGYVRGYVMSHRDHLPRLWYI